jgi:hypothetical protein
MRIFSKKHLRFHHPKDSEETVSIQSQSFGDVPDWVADSSMFKLASKDETVTVIESKKDELEAETGTKKDKKNKDKNTEPPADPPGEEN